MASAFIVITPLIAALLCAALIVVLRPLLVRYAMARPNARSSHTEPTPQGGGVAVIAATIAATLISAFLSGMETPNLLLLFSATVFIACVGAVDDLKPIPVLPRLLLQIAAVTFVLFVLSPNLRLFPSIPVWIERGILLLAGVWFVNLVNFMDGIDWITTAEIVPVTAALAFFGLFNRLDDLTLIALALGGAMLGFAPFNRPVAKLFLGDVGSLPIGLLVGWCLVQLAGAGHLTAALILPLYYLADATITLVHRLLNREAIWTAHRSHFYQRATNNGFTVLQIVREIFLLNLVLALLAGFSIFYKLFYVNVIVAALAAAATVFVLIRFSRHHANA